MAIVGTVRKQPNEIQDYDISFAEWLTGTDTVASAVVSISPAMTIAPLHVISPTGKIVKVWVYEGGVSGETYKVTVAASTAGGRVKEAELRVKIKEI